MPVPEVILLLLFDGLPSKPTGCLPAKSGTLNVPPPASPYVVPITSNNKLYVVVIYESPLHINHPEGAVVPAYGVTVPIGIVCMLPIISLCVVLYKLLPLATKNSSDPTIALGKAPLFVTNVGSITLFASVFVNPPVCPSNEKLSAETSPSSLNVVALFNFPALVADPVSVPVILKLLPALG